MVSHRKNPLVLTRTRCWTAVFAFGPLSSSYLCRLYWAFHFLCPWLNIRCSRLSSDIKQGVRFNFEVSERLFKLKCLPLLLPLICLAVPANIALSSYHPFVILASNSTPRHHLRTVPCHMNDKLPELFSGA